MQQPPPSVFENYATNPRPDVFSAGLTKLKALSADKSLWTLASEKEDVKLYTYYSDGQAVPTTRGVGTIKGYTLEQVLAVVHHVGCRAVWDARFDVGFPMERYNRNTVKFYASQKGVGWLVWGRDFTGVSGHVKEVDAETGKATLYYLQKSAEYDNTPEASGFVRGDLEVAGWIFREGADGASVEAEYIVKVDPKGSIPSSVVAMVATETPLCIAKVRLYLKDHGFPPYIPQHQEFPGVLQKETFENGTLHVNWKPSAPGDAFDVFYDKTRWTAGSRVRPQNNEDAEKDFETVEDAGKLTIRHKEGSRVTSYKFIIESATK